MSFHTVTDHEVANLQAELTAQNAALSAGQTMEEAQAAVVAVRHSRAVADAEASGLASRRPTPTPEQQTAARSRLEELAGDQKFGARLLAGESAAKSEWDELHRTAAGGRTLGDLAADTRERLHNMAIDHIADFHNLPPGVVAELREGRKVSAAEQKLVQNWKDAAMRDQAFVKRYLESDPEAGQKMMLASIVLSAEVERSAA